MPTSFFQSFLLFLPLKMAKIGHLNRLNEPWPQSKMKGPACATWHTAGLAERIEGTPKRRRFGDYLLRKIPSFPTARVSKENRTHASPLASLVCDHSPHPHLSTIMGTRFLLSDPWPFLRNYNSTPTFSKTGIFTLTL